MTINGLRRLTLLDYPGRVACTIFIAGCNLRCPFCHNALLVCDSDGGEIISTDALFSFLKKRRGMLDGVCITGGEPTRKKELPELIREIKALGYSVKLDTNGTNPGMLESLISEGMVDYVAMDIKNSSAKYPETVGLRDFDITPVRRSVEILLEAGKSGFDYEFRTTVVKELHEKSDFEEIGRWINGAMHYYLQQFVDSGMLLSAGMTACDEADMREYLKTVQQFIPGAALRGI